jgi:hypothetical protein
MALGIFKINSLFSFFEITQFSILEFKHIKLTGVKILKITDMNPVDELSDAAKDFLLEEVGNRLKIMKFDGSFKSHDSNEISVEELKKSEEDFKYLALMCWTILDILKSGFPYDQMKLKSLTENIQKLKNYDGVLNKEAYSNIINCLDLQDQVFTVPQTGRRR